MSNRYIGRSMEPVLRRAAREFPAVVLTGPRQSGKTTLFRRVFSGTHRYVSLEQPDARMSAAADPRAFLDMHQPPVIFDEAQCAPNLFPYIKEKIDAERSKVGQYLLTGSQNLLLMERVTESLAGRSAILRILPLSRREADGSPQRALPWESPGKGGRRAKHSGYRALWRTFLRGGYPELAAHPGRDGTMWHGSYVRTYLERDIRMLRQVGDLTQFQGFLQMLASRSAQLLNLTNIARDLGVAVNTAKAWLSALEATHQVIILRPYFANVGKRLVKTPKVYFTDTGTLCYLAGLKDPEHAASGPMGGVIMETAVLLEIVKTFLHRGVDPRIWFWRTSDGREIDILVEEEGKIVPIEVKLSATPRPAMGDAIRSFRDELGKKVSPGFVVYPGDMRLPLGAGVTALPFAEL